MTAETPSRQSWLRRLTIRIKKGLKSPGVTDRLANIERALELRALDGPQAEATAKQLEAVAGLLSALKDQDDVVIVIGSMVIAKCDGQLRCRNLTHNEIREFQKNPNHLQDSQAALRAINTSLPAAETKPEDH